MNKKLIGLGVFALVLGLAGSIANSAEAYRGDPSLKGPNYSAERHEAMEKAFETKDYTAWANLMQNKGRVTQVINKDNFAKFAEAHELAEQGKLTEAQKIRQDLGLGLKNGTGRTPGMGMGRFQNR